MPRFGFSQFWDSLACSGEEFVPVTYFSTSVWFLTQSWFICATTDAEWGLIIVIIIIIIIIIILIIIIIIIIYDTKELLNISWILFWATCLTQALQHKNCKKFVKHLYWLMSHARFFPLTSWISFSSEMKKSSQEQFHAFNIFEAIVVLQSLTFFCPCKVLRNICES